MHEEDSRPVVVNATPIITLSLIERLDLFRDLFGEVLIPEAVRREVLAGGSGRPGVQQLTHSPWIRTVALAEPRIADLLTDLDRGEAEVLALALEQQAGLVVLDERLARAHAKHLGLRMTGSLEVLLRAKEAGLVTAIAPLIDTIKVGGIHLGPTVVQRVLALAGEDL